MVVVSEIMMFIYAIAAVAFLGMICMVKEIIYPYKPTIQFVRKNRSQNYDWVTGRDYGGVILDGEDNDK